MHEQPRRAEILEARPGPRPAPSNAPPLLSSIPGRLRASRWVPYAVSVLSFLAAFGLQRLLWPYIAASPFVFFFAAVMLSGWWGGWGPGLLTLGLSLVAADFFFLPPIHTFQFRVGNLFTLGLYTLVSVLMTKLNVMLREANRERAALLERERQARSAAETERARLHALFMDAPVFIVFTHGPEHVYTFSNRLNDALMGHRAMVGRKLRDAVPEAEAQGLATVLDRVYATGEPFTAHALPLTLTQAGGVARQSFISLVYQPTRDEHGRIDGTAGFGVDVTELVHARKRAERLAIELRHTEARARVLAEASVELAASLDYETTLRNAARLVVPTLADWCIVDLAEPDGTFRRTEVAHARPEDAALARDVQRFQLLPGGNRLYPPGEALGRGEPVLVDALTPERIRQSTHDEEHARVMEATGIVSLISAPLVARGRTLGVLTLATTVHSGRSYTEADLSFGRELAHRAALSMENARLYREAQEAIRLRDEFLSIASHELKTPLTPLSLKLQALSRELARQREAVPRQVVESYVEVGTRQVKKLSELVGDLLDVSRITAGRLTLEWEDVELVPLVREVLARYEPHAARAGSTLHFEGDGARVTGRWDRLRLEQVITNLVDNAVKYGGGRPIHVRVEEDGGAVRLAVRDEGIGIAPEHLPRLFGRFERAVSERHYGGLGLGLYITRTLVEALGGTVRVESEHGRGSTFTVELPLDSSAAAAS